METTINDIASKHLGQSGSYAVYTDKFDSSLLVAMPRVLARKDWGITGKEFIGVDTWHCHEATFLLNNGLPVAGTLKISYDASSEFMVESKSIKLYTNSFDMCKMGEGFNEAVDNYTNQIKKDLSELLQTNVDVHFFKEGMDKHETATDPAIGYTSLYSLIDLNTLETEPFTDYSAQEKHLKIIEDKKDNTYSVFTNVLRSRCRHTKLGRFT